MGVLNTSAAYVELTSAPDFRGDRSRTLLGSAYGNATRLILEWFSKIDSRSGHRQFEQACDLEVHPNWRDGGQTLIEVTVVNYSRNGARRSMGASVILPKEAAEALAKVLTGSHADEVVAAIPGAKKIR